MKHTSANRGSDGTRVGEEQRNREILILYYKIFCSIPILQSKKLKQIVLHFCWPFSISIPFLNDNFADKTLMPFDKMGLCALFY